MRISKIVTSIIIGNILLIGNIFAAEIPGDCSMVIEEFWKNNWFTKVTNLRTNIVINHEAIIDSQTLNIALLNLRKVCCEHQDFAQTMSTSCNNDKPHFNTNVPQSYYLFDHFLDIILRRLDGDPKTIYPNATLDEKGEEWRTRSDEIMTKVEGTAPRIIENKHKEFRAIDSKNILRGVIQDTSKSKMDYINMMISGENLEIINRYEDRTLAERYENVCNVVGYMYFLFTDDNLYTISNTKGILLNSDACTILTKNRTTAETIHVTYMSMKKGNTLLVDSIQEFTNTYLDKRLADLQNLLQKSKTSLIRVVRAVPKLVRECT